MRVQIPLRVPAPLKAELERLAEDDGRSLNNYLVRALESHAAAARVTPAAAAEISPAMRRGRKGAR